MTALSRNTILVGDALTRLRELPERSVDCVVTSPPYYQLRDYGVTGQLGLEPTVEDWVDNLRAVMAEVGRVLAPYGSVWLNLGDSYSAHRRYGAAPKGLLLAPERLLLRLAADGWLVRNKVVWAKTNPLPTSVSDRLTTTYELLYLLVRARRYYFDLDAIRDAPTVHRRPTTTKTLDGTWSAPLAAPRGGLAALKAEGRSGHLLGKNPGDVWRQPTRGYRGAHFATFPETLIHRPILASCPEVVCTGCGQPWRRRAMLRHVGAPATPIRDRYVQHYDRRWLTLHQRGSLVPCDCGGSTRPGLVLDPFFGTGTVGAVAANLGRDWLGIELNPAYVALAETRLGNAAHAPPRQVAA
ncbi:MAG: DNA-methyltransferase [Frankiaceae bacterium]